MHRRTRAAAVALTLTLVAAAIPAAAEAAGATTPVAPVAERAAASAGRDAGQPASDELAAATGAVAVERFWSVRFGNAHFFTASSDEAAHVRGYDPNWIDEGIAFAVYPSAGGTCSGGTVPVHRFYSARFTSHFLTASAAEQEYVEANDPNWTYEGVAFCSPAESTPGAVRLYRFWSPRYGKHFYTADAAEAHQLDVNDPAWDAEGVAFWVLPATSVPGPPDDSPLGTIPFQIFPDDNPWNTSIASAQVDPASSTLVASIGLTGHLHPDFGAFWNGGPFGIPYTVVQAGTPKFRVTFDYDDESDPGPYPIPPDAPVEGGSDRHVLVVDASTHTLYELFAAERQSDGSWHAGSGAVFDLDTNASRPAGWTSADAAGLPILPGLVRYDEVATGQIDHALRFTVSETRRAYVAPATHYASSNRSASLPPMGMRVRLRADYDISGLGPQARVIAQAMKTYGMILADNGSDWYVSGTPDPRWDDEDLGDLKAIPGSAFEVVRMGPITAG